MIYVPKAWKIGVCSSIYDNWSEYDEIPVSHAIKARIN